jgi:hypothetical protein
VVVVTGADVVDVVLGTVVVTGETVVVVRATVVGGECRRDAPGTLDEAPADAPGIIWTPATRTATPTAPHNKLRIPNKRRTFVTGRMGSLSGTTRAVLHVSERHRRVQVAT